MRSTTNLLGRVKHVGLGLTLLGSLAVGVGVAPAAQAYAIRPSISVDANTLAVTGQGFTRGGTVVLYVHDTDSGLWLNVNGATSTAQIANGYARAGSFYSAALCGRYPHRHRCYRLNPLAGAFSYTPHVSLPYCDWADDALEVAAYDTRSRHWASVTVEYNDAGACQDSDSPDSADPPAPPDPGD